MSWENIRELIDGAQCDLAVILDCCASGGAAISPRATAASARGAADNEARALRLKFEKALKGLGTTITQNGRYSKELLAACSWESETRGHMSDAMCQVLQNDQDNPISLETLCENMNQVLGQQIRDGATQAVRHRFHTSVVRRKVRVPVFRTD